MPHSVRILWDLRNNFHALPCRQSVPQYQLQQEGKLASSKTKVCIRVKQLFTLFELQYLTHGRAHAWSFASFTPNLWRRPGWITVSFLYLTPPTSHPSILPCSLVVFSSTFTLFLLPPQPASATATLLPLCAPLELFISSFKFSACGKFMVTRKLHYVFSPPFFYELTALLISL